VGKREDGWGKRVLLWPHSPLTACKINLASQREREKKRESCREQNMLAQLKHAGEGILGKGWTLNLDHAAVCFLIYNNI